MITLLAELKTPPGNKTDTVLNEASSRKPVTAIKPDNAVSNVSRVTASTAPPVAAVHTPRAPNKASETITAQQAGNPSSNTSLSLTDLADRLQGRIQKALLPHFSYPLLARRRGWEGTVRVGLRVEANGSLTQLHVVESSRHDILDKAAVKSLVQVARIPDASNWLSGQHVDLILPIEYRLIEG